MSTVSIADTQQGLEAALDDVFTPFGGVHKEETQFVETTPPCATLIRQPQ